MTSSTSNEHVIHIIDINFQHFTYWHVYLYFAVGDNGHIHSFDKAPENHSRASSNFETWRAAENSYGTSRPQNVTFHNTGINNREELESHTDCMFDLVSSLVGICAFKVLTI